MLILESRDVFIEFLSALLRAGWKVIFTTRISYLDDLRFQMLEVYRLQYVVTKLRNLNEEELKGLAASYQFRLPANERLQNLIANLFYLGEYLSNYTVINDGINPHIFRDFLWQKRIQNSQFKKGNIHIERDRCFLRLAKERCDTGNFFIQGDECNSDALAQLENDEVIKYEQSQHGYFITHDIYEEWALEKIIEREYAAKVSHSLFFEKIGNSLAVRRVFRSWLSDKLVFIDTLIKQFIEQAFTDASISFFWKDELLISILLSDYSENFFDTFGSSLLENDKLYLKKIVFLLRTACKEVDEDTQKQIQGMKDSSISPAYVFTKAKGKGWEATIKYLHTNIINMQKNELPIVLPLLKDWAANRRTGSTTRFAGLFALHFYKDAELNSSSHYNSTTEESLLTIALNAAKELKMELAQIIDDLLTHTYIRHDAFDSLRQAVLSDNNKSLPFIANLPEHVIRLADVSWYQAKETKHAYDFGGYGEEKYYSIRSQWHHDYFPASGLQTPTYYLLHFAFPQTIQFLLSFINRTVTGYSNSGADSSVHEIEVTVNDETKKQYISHSLWNTYRGTGLYATPYLLQSIHMALEKYLLEITKRSDRKTLQDWLIYLLRHTRSASITAVVASVVLAYYDDFFDVAAILFRNYWFYKYDNLRAGSEDEARSLYSLGRGFDYKSKDFEDERMATCDQPHRRMSLENLALHYQFFKNEGIADEEVTRRQQEIWSIIDDMNATILADDSDTEHQKAVRLLLTRIDRRKMNPTLKHEGNNTIIAFNPSLEPDLKEYSEEGMNEIEERYKYSPLKAWATAKFENRTDLKPFPKYEDNPDQVLKETKELLEAAQRSDDQFQFFYYGTPAYTCAALVKFYSDRLAQEDLLFCNQIIISYATAPLRENYGYQIADGVEVAVNVLPSLYAKFPQQREDRNTVLLLLLFDIHSIGQYKRVCDYAIEAVRDNLFSRSHEDANAILYGYLIFKPKFDEYYKPGHRSSVGKSRAQALNEFADAYGADLATISGTSTYYITIEFGTLKIETAETAFQMIPADTADSTHLDFIQKVLKAFSSDLLAETDYSDKPGEINYKLKHRFIRHYVKFLLHRDVATIKQWTQPFVDAFTTSRPMADFLSDVVSENDRLNRYEHFWAIWKCFYPSIQSASLMSYHRNADEIIKNYLLAWPYWGNAKEWHSLKNRETVFFKKVSEEMGHHPAVLYSVAKLLNQIGTPFLNDGLFWIAHILSTYTELHKDDADFNTVYYLEILARRYVYLNRTNIKLDRLLKDKMLVILDYLVMNGSVNGYLLREEIF